MTTTNTPIQPITTTNSTNTLIPPTPQPSNTQTQLKVSLSQNITDFPQLPANLPDKGLNLTDSPTSSYVSPPNSVPEFDSMISTVIQLNEQIVAIASRMAELDNRLTAAEEKNPQIRKKKLRRRAQQIQRDCHVECKIMQCPYDNCAKRYGSEVSLNLHIRLKHGGMTKTERQNFGVTSNTTQRHKIQGESTTDARFALPADVMRSIEEQYELLNQKIRRT